VNTHILFQTEILEFKKIVEKFDFQKLSPYEIFNLGFEQGQNIYAEKKDIEQIKDVKMIYEYNMKLSEKRAGAVAGYIIAKGINTNRIQTKGYGETKPIASSDDERGRRKLNRRVEFTILKK